MFFALRVSWRLAAYASSYATGACSVRLALALPLVLEP